MKSFSFEDSDHVKCDAVLLVGYFSMFGRIVVCVYLQGLKSSPTTQRHIAQVLSLSIAALRISDLTACVLKFILVFKLLFI